MYELTRKGMPFHCNEIHQEKFELIKSMLIQPPVLHLPKANGRFILYLDTSTEHTGSSLWQRQDGHPRLIGYASKTLPTPCKNYSVTELEMTGLATNMHLWRHLFHNVDFDACVDHLSLVHILKSIEMSASTRTIRLLDHLSKFKFILYYMKGKDLILSDFLSRVAVDDADPSQCILIYFDPFELMHDHLNCLQDSFMITTRSKSKDSGITLPEVHGATKGLIPDYKPEHQHINKKININIPSKPHKPLAKRKTSSQIASKQFIRKSVNKDRNKTVTSSQIDTPIRSNSNEQAEQGLLPNTDTHVDEADDDFYQPSYQPRQLQPYQPHAVSTTTPPINQPIAHPPIEESDLEIDPNSPYVDQEIEPNLRQPTDSDFITPPFISELIESNRIIHRNLPTQTDIDKLLKQIERKVLRQLRLPNSIRDLQATYINSPYFEDIYIYLYSNKVPLKKKAHKKVQAQARDYFLMGDLLFKIINHDVDNNSDLKSVLCIPPSHAYILLEHYHSSIMGAHMDINKTYRTIQEIFLPQFTQYH